MNFVCSKYPEGWSSDEGRDPQLEFRISIMHAVKDDSGSFTCVTPARHTHTVEVVVKVGYMLLQDKLLAFLFCILLLRACSTLRRFIVTKFR